MIKIAKQTPASIKPPLYVILIERGGAAAFSKFIMGGHGE
jgi:hypothetical protein